MRQRNGLIERNQISLLSNASQSSATHKVGKKTVALRNTCSFDSICQVFF